MPCCSAANFNHATPCCVAAWVASTKLVPLSAREKFTTCAHTLSDAYSEEDGLKRTIIGAASVRTELVSRTSVQQHHIRSYSLHGLSVPHSRQPDQAQSCAS